MSPYAKMVLYFSLIAVLIVFSAFFSCADMVYSSVSQVRLRKTKGKRSKVARSAYEMAKNYDSTIVTILFGNNLVNIVASSLGAAISVLPLEPFSINPGLAATIIELSMLVIILVFGEILPKNIGRKFNYPLSMAFVGPIKVFSIIFYPFTKVASFIVRKLSKPVITLMEEDDDIKTEEELQAMVDVIEQEGIIDEDQSELLTRSLEFKDTEASMVMTPRVHIQGLEVDEDPIRAIESGKLTNSRIPVYKKNLDNIIGYIPLKNLQKALLRGKKPEIEELMLPILSVPSSMPISSVLALFKQNKSHIALVKDEFGGNEGILTMEDILEELVGEMYDETESRIEYIQKLEKRNTYRVLGSMQIEAFNEKFGLSEEEGEDFVTVSGYITAKLGRFAKAGDKFKDGKIDVQVEKADPYVVESAIVSYHPRRKAK